ncbi:MAG: hypothetical protein HRT66_03595 [Flavobacteriaceae bacterium]|nr:hypothetical protein [Flavobacteriaceae bacterium]
MENKKAELSNLLKEITLLMDENSEAIASGDNKKSNTIHNQAEKLWSKAEALKYELSVA